MLPLALLALIIQVLAPVAASAMTAAAAIAIADPAGAAVICHAEPDAAPTGHESDRTACGLDCVMCAVLHDAAAPYAPSSPVHRLLLRGWTPIEWSGRAFGLVDLLAWSQTQPRGPPFAS
ncbi:hypothetical protein SSBR45G_07900 [Bradyrhizobium sp. SSBR45G]|uniref:DUF2946 family protein n=1 Tax=unclassified Bradyrhizobium TaxID=2631580 RepID=UPI002342A470|nr:MULTISPECIES: hypothetical protein [unclassified Bradyrhizobium]GLH75882.1 hypothetical protein SSBR45G_07900 [Bradyrhizobium sp. SSBR45G]GLH85119.1 hypothetical protein SSBR45R_25790 [Bradyrhizobium sp. SSBR45R]